MVQASELERVELELRGELVHRLLEHRHALDDPRGAERVLRPQARPHGERHGADVRAGVERESRLGDREDVAAGAHLDHRGELDGRERPVAARAERDGLPGRRAAAADDLILVTIEREPHRAARRPRELRREERLGPGALLAAETAADVLGEHAHLLGVESEASRTARAARRRSPASRPRR